MQSKIRSQKMQTLGTKVRGALTRLSFAGLPTKKSVWLYFQMFNIKPYGKLNEFVWAKPIIF